MIRRVLAVLVAAFTLCAPAVCQYATLTGTLSSTNGMPASNYILNFTPSQFGFVAGTGVIVNTSTNCATSVDGAVVGIPNPLIAPMVTVGFTGSLAPANYFVKYGFYDANGNLTLVSPETVIQLNSTGRLIVASPSSGMPAGAVGMKVYLSASTNVETLQGTTTGAAAFIQQTPLVTGTTPPTTNTTICKQIANDAIWPTGTGYTVSMTDPSGNTIPGYPMMWQLMGPNSTINLSSGLPYYHGTVYFPTPLLASPLNHQLQSIAGPLSLSGYMLSNVGSIGVGTNLPAWPIDVRNGAINASGGYILNGGAGVATGNCLLAGSDSFHTFNVPGTCLTSVGTLFYQTVASNGTAQTQRGTLNFSPRFTLSDSASPAQTNVDLSTVGSGSSCTLCNFTYDAYGRVTSSSNSSTTITFTQTDLTGSRALGTTYQNTSGAPMMLQGYVTTVAGGADGVITCSNGPTSGLGNSPYVQNPTATDAGGSAEFHLTVPTGWFYQCTATGTMNATLTKWFETVL